MDIFFVFTVLLINDVITRATTTGTSVFVNTFNIWNPPTNTLQLRQQHWQKPDFHHIVTLSATTVAASNKPQRLSENVDGVVYVNDRCIDCAACAGFASNIFQHNVHADAHVVYQQPQTESDIAMTRAAVAACPVAAIRIETSAERRHAAAMQSSRIQQAKIGENTAINISWTDQDMWTVQQMTSKDHPRPFPRPFLLFNDTDMKTTRNSAGPDVYWIGHHNERSFGAIPYLVKVRHNNNDNVWIMVDVPKFNVQSVKDVISITGPNGPHYLFMTHVDDTADHNLWANYFNSTSTNYCQRIFHASDLGRYNWIGDTSLEHVPILLQEPPASNNVQECDGINATPLNAYTLDGTLINNTNWVHDFENGLLLNNTNVVIVHTPGHSPGSCTLYKRRTTTPGILFTGDTYAYSRKTDRMTGFPRYGRNMVQLNQTLHALVHELKTWDIIAPGHGISRDYRNSDNFVKYTELRQAQEDLFVYQRQR